MQRLKDGDDGEQREEAARRVNLPGRLACGRAQRSNRCGFGASPPFAGRVIRPADAK